MTSVVSPVLRTYDYVIYNKKIVVLRTSFMGAEETTAQLCVLPVLTEDLSLVVGTHAGQLSTFRISTSGES